MNYKMTIVALSVIIAALVALLVVGAALLHNSLVSSYFIYPSTSS
jgi:hypothetical protein